VCALALLCPLVLGSDCGGGDGSSGRPAVVQIESPDPRCVALPDAFGFPPGYDFVPGVPALLQLDRAALGAGELWRILTCHWAHWSLDHLVWDVLAFGVLGLLAIRHCPRRTLALLGISAVAISARL